jgi:Rrf2 family transcriptional regulator, cysteine metabolism repressor
MFQISTKLDYGIILLRALAEQYEHDPISLKTISKTHGLPHSYLMQIATPLKKAGLIKSFEGAKGGYTLSRRPSEISLQDITMVLEPSKKLTRCLRTDHNSCKLKPNCSMSPWWFHFNVRFQKLVHDIKLSDLL